MYSLAHFRPRESRTVNYVSCHWGLFPEELVEIEWIGYRECQEITYWVQKHFYHWYCILIGRWHIRDRLDVIHQTTFYRMEISVFCLKCTGLYCTPGMFLQGLVPPAKCTLPGPNNQVYFSVYLSELSCWKVIFSKYSFYFILKKWNMIILFYVFCI